MCTGRPGWNTDHWSRTGESPAPSPPRSPAGRRPSRSAARLRCAVVFDSLSDKLQGALGDLRKSGKLDEEAISRAMREIRLALLEADVNFTVVRDFVERVRERGARRGGAEEPHARPAGREGRPRRADRADGRRRVRPGARQVHGHPARRPPGLGQDDHRRRSSRCSSARQGRKPGSSPPTCSAPPRSTSSSSSASRSTCRSSEPTRTTRSRRRAAGSSARAPTGLDTVIVDTAGRLQIDEELMDELERVRDAAKPTNALLVARRDDRPGGGQGRAGVPASGSRSTA